LAAPDHEAELAHLIDRLGARFGLRRVTRQMEEDTHIPEYAVMAVGAASAQAVRFSAHSRASGNPVLGLSTGSPLSRGRAALQYALEQDSLAPIRPIRLFAHPEPIEAVAEVPDGPPAQFVWRRMRHTVLHVEGPERIAMEWWRDADGNALMRDYFRVESHDGLRVWLYRAWPTGPHFSTPWYVHGMFA
jgi:protein ImuB